MLALQGFFPSVEIIVVISTIVWPICFLYPACTEKSIKSSLKLFPLFYVGITLRYLFTLGETPEYILTMLGMAILVSILLFIPFFVYGILYRKFENGLVTLAFPILFFIVQLAFSQLMHMGNSMDPVTAVSCIPVLAQNVALVGEMGLSLIMTWMWAAIVCIADKKSVKVRVVFSAICAALLVFGFVYGAVRLSGRTGKEDSLRVAFLTSVKENFYDPIDTSKDERYIELFEKLMSEISESETDLIMTNEEFAFLDSTRFEEYMVRVRAAIAKAHVPTLFCYGKYETGGDEIMYYDSAILFDENGEQVTKFSKHNRILLVETGSVLPGDDEPAEAVITIKGKPRKVAIAICFDLNDELFINKMSEDTELILAPSWDWYNVCYFQPRNTLLRAIECNATLIKATYSGIAFTADEYGIINDEEDTLDRYEQVVYLDVPVD